MPLCPEWRYLVAENNASHMARRKPLPNREQRRKAARRRKRTLIGIVALIALPVIGGLIYMAMPQSPPETGPRFTKQGELKILAAEDSALIKTIDIEVKQDERGRAEGMMWRKSMEENQGMLFIMERSEPQSFWMRNTYIPLDITFISEDKRIVNIRRNAQPQSLSPQPSKGDAKYVLEVIGGFSDKFGVEAGDRIEFAIGE